MPRFAPGAPRVARPAHPPAPGLRTGLVTAPAHGIRRETLPGYSPAGTCSAAARTSISRQNPARIA